MGEPEGASSRVGQVLSISRGRPEALVGGLARGTVTELEARFPGCSCERGSGVMDEARIFQGFVL